MSSAPTGARAGAAPSSAPLLSGDVRAPHNLHPNEKGDPHG
jgi:hypothetical protein